MAENARQPIIATWSTEPGESYNRPVPVGSGFPRGTVAAGTIISKPPQRVDPLSGSGHIPGTQGRGLLNLGDRLTAPEGSGGGPANAPITIACADVRFRYRQATRSAYLGIT